MTQDLHTPLRRTGGRVLASHAALFFLKHPDLFGETMNVHCRVDLWGHDVNHDWPWWRRQFPYFLSKILR